MSRITEHIERSQEYKAKACDLEERSDQKISVLLAKAQVEALTAIAVGMNIFINALIESCCGHGTPTLFSPCVDCERRNNQ